MHQPYPWAMPGRFALRLCRWGWACILMLAAMAPSAFAAEPVLRVGFFDLPPHGQLKDGKPSGHALAYFDRIARQMGVTPDYVQLPLARLLVSPDIDMVLYLGKTRERAQTLVFARKPWLVLQGAIAVRTGSPLRTVQSADDLVGLHMGAWNAGFRSQLMRDARLRVTPISGDDFLDRALKMVVHGHIDGFYNPEIHATQAGIQRLGLGAQLRVVRLPSTGDALYPAFTAAGAAKYRKRFEAAFDAVAQRGSYTAFMQQQYALR
ncbi:MAG: transporter substrate-binding domain-containing protein [Rhodoferax sp.]|nr:MAG: transporter substrate-binding domain-containing protein [Rhodoferax sp.]